MKKTDTRHRTGFGHWLRFGVRALGLTGTLALGAGLMLTPEGGLHWKELLASASGVNGAFARVTTSMIVAGAALVAILLILELAGSIMQSAGRKAAEGTNAALQIVLAVALLLVVNALSFEHYFRTDTTRDERFTIGGDLQQRLKKLNPETPTKVIVLQRDKTANIEPDNPGALEAAAQAKVVEKVRDVVEELRELGPRFQVSVLATRDENFEAQLEKLTGKLEAPAGESPEAAAKRETENRERQLLNAAIRNAPENSVFFAANGRVQRLGFNQFYLLDKTASRSQDRPEGRNLVLVPQGKAAFIEKVLALEERTPKVALLTIHPLLTTKLDNDDYSASGLRRALENQGYEVTDVLLKRWAGRGTPPAAADSFAEKELTTLERSLPAAQFAVTRYESQAEAVGKLLERLKKSSIDEINRLLRNRLPRNLADEDDRKSLLDSLSAQEFSFRELAKEKRAELAKNEAEYYELLKDDRAVESLRNQDVKAKLQGYVRDCDLLIVPRLTMMQLSNRAAVPAWLHSMNKDQADVVREFMKAGKPVLFAMGPTAADPPEPNETSNDDIEKMLARLGIDLGSDAIITDAEVKATPDSDDPFAVPADPFQLRTGLEFPSAPLPGKKPNPVAVSSRAAAHSVDADLDANRKPDAANVNTTKIAEKKRVVFSIARNGGYRSVTVTPPVLAGLSYSPEILHTIEKSWNESKPLKEEGYVPTFDPPKPDDPKKGGREDEVMKAYTVGVALEAKVPAEWNDPKASMVKFFHDAMALAPGVSAFPPGLAISSTQSPDALGSAPADAKTLRVIVYGHGGMFIGKTLDPGRETLLLNSVNWLLNRSDRLPADKPEEQKWRYPRVALSPERLNLWSKATQFGLPAIAIYSCFMVLMIRRMR